MERVGEVVLLLAVGGAFFSARHRFLCGDELLIGGVTPLDVRQDMLVEHIKAGPSVPPAAPGEPAAVPRLPRLPWLHGAAGAAGLRVVLCVLARRQPDVAATASTSAAGHRGGEKTEKRRREFLARVG